MEFYFLFINIKSCYFLTTAIFKMNISFKHLIKYYWQQYFECLFWITSFVVLFFMDAGTTAPSLCIFKWLHLSHCPGCGLGHAIHCALHFQFVSSFQQHPMGIVAVLIILNRIKQLSFKSKTVIQ